MTSSFRRPASSAAVPSTVDVYINGLRSFSQNVGSGPFEINGSASVMRLLDDLLAAFVAQKRMKISGNDYVPCYRVS